MQGNKENQELSVLGRLVSLEALLFVMGVVSLVYGLLAARLLNTVIGGLILAAAIVVARRYRRGSR